MAKNTLMIFSNEELDIELQGMLYNGKPVFIAVEIAKALGYERPHDALSAHCKSLIKIKYGEMASLGFEPKPNGMSLLTEPDLYRLILRSKLSSAERVQDWVCEEVLPAIRQTGGYQIQPQLSADYFLNNPEVTIALISGQANKILALSHTVETVSAGHGLNLQDGGNILVFFSHWWDLEQYQQIIERIGPTRQAQAGYHRPVFVHHIIAHGTMDEMVMERRNSKREVQDILLEAMKKR